jgi:hypothetical protein
MPRVARSCRIVAVGLPCGSVGDTARTLCARWVAQVRVTPIGGSRECWFRSGCLPRRRTGWASDLARPITPTAVWRRWWRARHGCRPAGHSISDVAPGVTRSTWRHGWQVTGVDLAGSVLDVARRKAAEAGVAVRLVRGDVTRLGELNLGEGYLLLMDGGCYHMVPMSRRDAYVDGITRAAAPGAFLIMVGFSHHRFTGGGVTAEDLRHRFSGWELTHGPDPVPAAEMLDYVSGPAPVRSAIRRGWLTASRFQLRRTSTGFGPIG